MNDYIKQKRDLLQKVRRLPEWQQRMFFAKAAALGLVTITEKDLPVKLRLIKSEEK